MPHKTKLIILAVLVLNDCTVPRLEFRWHGNMP